MTDPKPIPHVTHDEAEQALQTLAENAVALGDSALRCVGAHINLSLYVERQRALSATRQADVATVRNVLSRVLECGRCHECDALGVSALEALDRLGEE